MQPPRESVSGTYRTPLPEAVIPYRHIPLCLDSTSSGKGVIRLLDQSKHHMIKFITNVVMVNW